MSTVAAAGNGCFGKLGCTSATPPSAPRHFEAPSVAGVLAASATDVEIPAKYAKIFAYDSLYDDADEKDCE